MDSPGYQLLNNFRLYIVDPAMLLVFTLGFLVFIWGLLQFMWHLKDGSGHDEGVKHMLWGTVGMFIMVSVNGILALIINFVGPNATNPDTSRLNAIQVPNIFGNSQLK